MSKKNVSSAIVACISVMIACVIAITVVIINFADVPNDTDGSSSDTSSYDTASLPSDTESEHSSSNSSSEGSSSVTNTSSVTSSDTSSVTSSKDDSSSTKLPNPDDNPFSGIEKPQGEMICYLTFDDGPCANTDKILNILADENVKATFFVVGSMSTGKIKSIYDAGHAIGLHTGNHELNQLYKNPDAFFADLKKISDIVYEKIGIRSNLTRFPGGSATAYSRLGKEDFQYVKEILKEQGYTYFDWNIDSGDTHKASPSEEYVMGEIRKYLTSGGKYKSEVCILMHDIKNVTVRILPELIKELKEAGYSFAVLNGDSPTFSFK